MPIVKGRAATRRFIEQLPATLEKGILRGAAKAGAAVVMEEAKARVASDEVAEGLQARLRSSEGRITVRINLKDGWARSLGTWLEYGTSGHFISVDPAFADGRTARRINTLDRQAAKEGRSGPGATLVINGKPVGRTVWHPGARAEPWLLPALDHKESEAKAAAQAYINARIRRSGLLDEDGDD